jgi:hypothetical protein
VVRRCLKNSSPFSFVGRWEYAAMILGLGGALVVLAGAARWKASWIWDA